MEKHKYMFLHVEPNSIIDGGVRLNIVVDNVDRLDDLEVFIGEREVCLDVRLEPDGLSCLVPPGQPSSTIPIEVRAESRVSNNNLTITYYTPIDEISELIRDPLERKRINLTQCPDYPGAPEQLQYVIVALPASDYGQFFIMEGSDTPVVEAKETLVDINGSLWYQPSPNYHGIFHLQYYCRDKNGGSRTNPIKVRIAVAPYLNCEAEALINDALTLTTRDIFSDKLRLKISTPPQSGNLTSLQSEDAIPMKYDQPFQENTVRYVATYAVANRSVLLPEFAHDGLLY
ncbi:hypothetical protein BKA69DRAFT_79351 [Paraphysoderma sedebokerense]|nr:hypothetical protein BKA69DRAFT_112043 [Paraphysoderma sedebokerense]KAI9136868.1 hypothetical protein BKA69DRAFT_79351 [Paraphysoderma sedebokerense]